LQWACGIVAPPIRDSDWLIRRAFVLWLGTLYYVYVVVAIDTHRQDSISQQENDIIWFDCGHTEDRETNTIEWNLLFCLGSGKLHYSSIPCKDPAIGYDSTRRKLRAENRTKLLSGRLATCQISQYIQKYKKWLKSNKNQHRKFIH